MLREDSERVVPTEIFPASGANLAGLFDQKTPVVLDNDVNWMAVAEAENSDGSLMMLYIGAGLGAGLVIDGKLHRGRHGTAGELENQPPVKRTYAKYWVKLACSRPACSGRSWQISARGNLS